MTNQAGREQLDTTLRRLDDTLTEMEGGGGIAQQVRRQPLLTLGAVVALGYLLGSRLRSRGAARRGPARWISDTARGYGRPMTTNDFAQRHSGAVER